jgi:hypothetical protein
VPCEAARYGAAVLYLPDLWVDAATWRAWAAFLGHRGWEGWLLPLRAVAGGVAERAAAVVEFAGTLSGPPVLLGEGAGGVVAALVARQIPVTAVVVLAPIVPRVSHLGTLLARRDAWWPLLTGGRVPPPSGATLAALLGVGGAGPPADVVRGLAPESASVLLDLARGRVAIDRLMARSLVLCGDADAFTTPAAAQAWAQVLGAEFEVLAGLPHRFSADASWQRIAGHVHRWLVRGLDAAMLEFYAEAIADRDDDTD